MAAACLLTALVALNFLWLMGFTSFLLGSALFPITLRVWWKGRAELRLPRLAAISMLLVLGYFAHLVSLGLTALALGLLAILAPVSDGASAAWGSRARRVGRTALCSLPLLALAQVYLRLTRQGGPMRPVWENLANATSGLGWFARIGWVDPLTICRKTALPFTERTGALCVVFAPLAWLALAGFLLLACPVVARVRRWAAKGELPIAGRGEIEGDGSATSKSERRVWIVLGLLLLAGGLAGPDSLGPGHGEYLPQRITLLGLAALVPSLNVSLGTRLGRLTVASLATALALQSILVWDYALHSERTAGQLIRAGDLVGRDQRVATLLIQIRSRFRANPLIHADSWLGVGSGNILWSNYHTRFYYFPVQFRVGLDRPDPRDFERLAFSTDPAPGVESVRLWESMLAAYPRSIDRVVVWGSDPRLDAITARWGFLLARRGGVSVFARRKP
jgi:hypothetical protein